MQKLINIVIGFTLSSGLVLSQEAKLPEASVLNTTKQTPLVEASAKAVTSLTSSKEKVAGVSEKTEHNFEDLLVQGKYHFSDEAVTTVEEDKVLDSLLGVRSDFKDKIEQSAGRY